MFFYAHVRSLMSFQPSSAWMSSSVSNNLQSFFHSETSALYKPKAKNQCPTNHQQPNTKPVRIHQSSAGRKYNEPPNERWRPFQTPHTAPGALSHDKHPSCSLLCHVWLQCLVYGTVKMHCPIERGDFDRDMEQEEVHQPLTRQTHVLHSPQ